MEGEGSRAGGPGMSAQWGGAESLMSGARLQREWAGGEGRVARGPTREKMKWAEPR
jgi:hypothetical protein